MLPTAPLEYGDPNSDAEQKSDNNESGGGVLLDLLRTDRGPDGPSAARRWTDRAVQYNLIGPTGSTDRTDRSNLVV